MEAVFGCRAEETDMLIETITDKTDAQAVCKISGEEYIDIDCL